MDAEKLRKLEEFTVLLKKHGGDQESQGHHSEAVKDYVKLVDILLLLAREAKDHPTWERFTAEAESYQKRARMVIASSQPKQSQNLSSIASNQATTHPKTQSSVRSIPPQIQTINLPVPPSSESGSQIELEAPDSAQMEALVEENEQLKSKIASMVERSEYESIRAKNTELSRQLEDSVPLAEFQAVEEKLADSVPASQFRELQNTCATMVPREEYESLRERFTELESRLHDSLPRSVLDNLAKEVSFLALTIALPGEISPSGNFIEGNQPPFRPRYLDQIADQSGLYELLQDLRQRMDIVERRSRSELMQTGATARKQDPLQK
jgi:hypothetical protein